MEDRPTNVGRPIALVLGRTIYPGGRYLVLRVAGLVDVFLMVFFWDRARDFQQLHTHWVM